MQLAKIKGYFWLLVYFTLLPAVGVASDKTTSVSPKQVLSLQTDNGGAIQHLFIHFADYDIIPTLYSLLQALPHTTRLSMAVRKGKRADLLRKLVESWKIAEPQRFNYLELTQPMNFWVRDDFVVASGNRLIVPQRHTHQGLPESLVEITKNEKLSSVYSTLKFDGGNVVVGDNVVFVGYNLILENISPALPTEKALYKSMVQLFGKPVIAVGSPEAPVPHEHIDMFITPLHDGSLLVGDPKMAVDILDKQPGLMHQAYGKVYFDETTTPLQADIKQALFSTDDFVSRLNGDLLVANASSEEPEEELTLPMLYAKNALPSTIRSFDRIVTDLRNKGFKKIRRIPILINRNIDQGPFITYNNMLLDDVAGKKIAYLPRYNLAPLDQAAKQVMEKAGYEVRPIDVQNIAFYDGTLRCITQVLNRGGS